MYVLILTLSIYFEEYMECIINNVNLIIQQPISMTSFIEYKIIYKFILV